MKRLLSALLGLSLGCAWSPGAPPTRVLATLHTAFDPVGRTTTDGWLRLSSDFELQLDRFTLQAAGAELQSLSAAGGGGMFDPTNPPAGYSCHGGHCHTPDGRNLTYEEVAAELSGGGGFQTQVAYDAPDPTIDALVAAEVALSCTDCELPAGEVTRAQLSLAAVRVEGRVRDSRTPARFEGERTFSFSLPAEDTPLQLGAAVLILSDRFSPATLQLTLALTVSPRPFDAVPWEQLAPDSEGHLPLDAEANHELLDELLAQFATSALAAAVASDPEVR